MRRPKRTRKTWLPPQAITFSHAICLALAGPVQWSPPTEEQGRSHSTTPQPWRKQRTLHSLPEGEPLKTQTWNTQNAKARPRPGLKRAIRQKTRPPDVRRSSTEPHHVLKNQRDTPGRVTTGQEPRNPRHYSRSVRAQENGSTWHFRTSTSRTANHPEKAETASGVKPWWE